MGTGIEDVAPWAATVGARFECRGDVHKVTAVTPKGCRTVTEHGHEYRFMIGRLWPDRLMLVDPDAGMRAFATPMDDRGAQRRVASQRLEKARRALRVAFYHVGSTSPEDARRHASALNAAAGRVEVAEAAFEALR